MTDSTYSISVISRLGTKLNTPLVLNMYALYYCVYRIDDCENDSKLKSFTRNETYGDKSSFCTYAYVFKALIASIIDISAR